MMLNEICCRRILWISIAMTYTGAKLGGGELVGRNPPPPEFWRWGFNHPYFEKIKFNCSHKTFFNRLSVEILKCSPFL